MINFENARLLSYDHQHEFFGDNLNYAIQKHISIEGFIYSPTSQSGVDDVWTGIIGLVESATDYDSIIVNGTNLGAGRINSIRFAEGNDVRLKKYTVDITILAAGNLFNTNEFSGISFDNIYLTESCSENFQFSIAEDGTYSYTQNVSIKYVTADTVTDPIQAAKDLAHDLLFSTPAYGFIDASHVGFYNHAGKRTYTERYNKITNQCSFTENFVLPLPSDDGTYSIKYTQQIQTAENGISTVSESGRVEGLVQTDFMGSARAGLNSELAGVYARCAALLTLYFPSARALNTTYTTREQKINQFTNSIEYRIEFNNDPRNQPTYSWDYTQEFARRETCYYVVKESGHIKGITPDCTRIEQYNNALAAWGTIQTGIASRAQTFYQDHTTLSNTLQSISTEVRNSIHAGEIAYSYSYTDDPTYNNNQPIKRNEIQITDDFPVELLNRFAVGHVGEIEQDLGAPKDGKRSITLKMLGKRATVFSVYLSTAIEILNSLIPTGDDIFVSSCTYNFNPIEHVFDLQLSWTYFAAVGGLLV